MTDDASRYARHTHAQARLRFILAAICCGVFVAFLILLAIVARTNPLGPLSTSV